jgi:hypothetical protein
MDGYNGIKTSKAMFETTQTQNQLSSYLFSSRLHVTYPIPRVGRRPMTETKPNFLHFKAIRTLPYPAYVHALVPVDASIPLDA